MNETIAAISTAPGEGAIGIVRISGDSAKEILGKLFYPQTDSFEDRKLYYGTIREPSSVQVIDEVLAVYMAAPRTYTRDDVVEIFCHGSYASTKKIFDAVLSLGARAADPGEFTKRAFLNGRIDLTQADAVIDLIRAKTDLAHDTALGQLGGKLGGKIRSIRLSLADAMAETVALIDYPDEGEDESTVSPALLRITETVEAAASQIDELIATADTGRMICEGVYVVITGKPNVGKSSLLNALLRETRAIVSDVPGTTRDRIEEYANIHGLPVRFVDTAGIREAEGEIERIGIDMTTSALDNADVVLFLVDGSKEIDDNDIGVAEHLGDKRVITVLTKSDLCQVVGLTDVDQLVPKTKVVSVSALNGNGIDELENAISDCALGGFSLHSERVLVTNSRQLSLLREAFSEAEMAAEDLRLGVALDFAETNMRAAYSALGEIIGETVSDEILDLVFERFCVGK